MHIWYLILTACVGMAILSLGEFGRHRCWFKGERARKFSHIMIGIFAATWPLYLYQYEICAISVALVVGILISKHYGWFHSTREVHRRTYGELLFAVAIGLLTFVAANPAIYAVAMLHLALADGMAAVVGGHWGTSRLYKVMGETKSILGTATFVLVSVLLIMGYAFTSGVFVPFTFALGVAIGAAALENAGIWGADNVLVPVFAAALLNLLA